jgi:reactive intermediate/imine deaminase
MKRITLALGVALTALVVAAGAADSARKYIVMKRPNNSTAPFSEAVLSGDTLYIAGHIGLDPQTGKPGETAEQEARLVMESFKKTIEEAGMEMDDLVSVTVYSSDVSDYSAFNAVYRPYFHGNFPARAYVGSGKLLFGARFEVQGIAVKRAKK